MHFYDSIVVFERGRVEKPTHRKRGHPTTDDPDWTPERPEAGREAEPAGPVPALAPTLPATHGRHAGRGPRVPTIGT